MHADAQLLSGEGGIRTLGTQKGTPVFETGPFDHSGTSPKKAWPSEIIALLRYQRLPGSLADARMPFAP